MLVNNIGNGVYTLTIARIGYEKTGSPAIFGQLLVAEYIIIFLLQMYAGMITDRKNPKYICVTCDMIRGISLFLSTAIFVVTGNMLWIGLQFVVISITKPFYRSPWC